MRPARARADRDTGTVIREAGRTPKSRVSMSKILKRWRRSAAAMKAMTKRWERRAEHRRRTLRRKYRGAAGREKFKVDVLEALDEIFLRARRINELVRAIGRPPKKSIVTRAADRLRQSPRSRKARRRR